MLKEKTAINQQAIAKNNCPGPSELSSSPVVLPVFIELRDHVIKRIELDKICYVCAECTCSTFYLDDNSQLTSLKSLHEVETMLPSNFIRIHRNCIVNILKISELQIGKRNIMLTNGKQLTVSCRNIKALSARLLAKN